MTTCTTARADGSLDSDMLSVSDQSERLELFGSDPTESEILSRVFHQLLFEWSTTTRERPQPSQSDQQSSNIPQNSNTSGSQTSGNSRPSQQKRRREFKDNGGDESDGADDGSSGSAAKRRAVTTARSKILACPFWKKNPLRHRECFSLKLTRIKDVKQHLGRRHAPIHCPICFRVFEDREARASHFSTSNSGELCTPMLHAPLEGIDMSQGEDLRKRANRAHTREQQWYDIWQILFPDADPPQTPYMDFDQLPESAAWADFCNSRGSSLLAEVIDHRIWDLAFLPDNQRRQELVRVVQSGFPLVFEAFHSESSASDSSLTSSNSQAARRRLSLRAGPDISAHATSLPPVELPVNFVVDWMGQLPVGELLPLGTEEQNSEDSGYYGQQSADILASGPRPLWETTARRVTGQAAHRGNSNWTRQASYMNGGY